MTVFSINPLFQIPGIGTIHQHFQVMIGFQYYKIKPFKNFFYLWLNITHVSSNSYFYSLIFYYIAYRCTCIMRDRKRGNPQISNHKFFSKDTAVFLFYLSQFAAAGIPGGFICINWKLIAA